MAVVLEVRNLEKSFGGIVAAYDRAVNSPDVEGAWEA